MLPSCFQQFASASVRRWELAKLTKRLVDAAEARDREYFLWDDELHGFGSRVLPSGRRTYVVQYRATRRTRRMNLGPPAVLTPREARRRAARALAEVHAGGDPSVTRSAEGVTVADLAKRDLREHASTKKKPRSAAKDERNLVLLSKMMNLAEGWGLRPDGSDPCRHVERYPERRLERFLSSAELARLGEVLADAERDGREPASVIAAIRLLVLTGARRSEILNLR